MVNGFRAKYQPRNQSQSIRMLSKYICWWWPKKGGNEFFFNSVEHTWPGHARVRSTFRLNMVTTDRWSGQHWLSLHLAPRQKTKKLVSERGKMMKSKNFKHVEACWLTGSEDFQNCRSVLEPARRLGQTVPVNGDLTSQLTGPKESFRVQWRPHLYGSRLFLQQKGKKQGFKMLSLINI